MAGSERHGLRRSDPGSGRVVVREERPAAGSEGAFAGRVYAAGMPDGLGDGLRRSTAGMVPGGCALTPYHEGTGRARACR
jgi:hypothetical protein